MIVSKQPNEIDVYVGSRIRFRRKLLGISQEKLAEGLNLTFQQVQKYEKGENRVGASRLLAVANILQVDPSFFFLQPAGEPLQLEGVRGREADGISSFLLTKEGLELNRAFAAIGDPQIRRQVVSLVRSIAEGRSDDSENDGTAPARDNRINC